MVDPGLGAARRGGRVGVLRGRLHGARPSSRTTTRPPTTTTTTHHHHHHDTPRRDAVTKAGILGVGVGRGPAPCPSALVVLLSAIALHRVGLGMVLIVAFSFGLAATITAIGLVAVIARRVFGRIGLDGPVSARFRR